MKKKYKTKGKIVADYMVGKGSGKDRYTVGWNESKQNASAYKVGTSGSGGGAMPGSKSLPGDQDPVVGSKSQFNHDAVDTKDDGSESANMGFGGQIKVGLRADGPGDTYAEKGNWSDSSNAMAKRKAMMDAYKSTSGSNYTSPTVDLVNVKK